MIDVERLEEDARVAFYDPEALEGAIKKHRMWGSIGRGVRKVAAVGYIAWNSALAYNLTFGELNIPSNNLADRTGLFLTSAIATMVPAIIAYGASYLLDALGEPHTQRIHKSAEAIRKANKTGVFPDGLERYAADA